MNDEYMKVSINDHSFRLRCKKSVSKADIYTSTYCMEKQVPVDGYILRFYYYCLKWIIQCQTFWQIGMGVLDFFVIQIVLFRGNLWVWFLLLLFSPGVHGSSIYIWMCAWSFFSLFFFFLHECHFPPCRLDGTKRSFLPFYTLSLVVVGSRLNNLDFTSPTSAGRNTRACKV